MEHFDALRAIEETFATPSDAKSDSASRPPPPRPHHARRGAISLPPEAASEIFSGYADGDAKEPAPAPKPTRHARGRAPFSEPASSYVDTTPALGHVVDDKRSADVIAAAAGLGSADATPMDNPVAHHRRRGAVDLTSQRTPEATTGHHAPTVVPSLAPELAPTIDRSSPIADPTRVMRMHQMQRGEQAAEEARPGPTGDDKVLSDIFRSPAAHRSGMGVDPGYKGAMPVAHERPLLDQIMSGAGDGLEKIVKLPLALLPFKNTYDAYQADKKAGANVERAEHMQEESATSGVVGKMLADSASKRTADDKEHTEFEKSTAFS